VLIVDDVPELRDLLRLQLARRPEILVVGQVGDAAAAVAVAVRLVPDLVFLDMATPRMEGLHVLPLIRSAVPRARIIVFSSYQGVEAVSQALALGADRYVLRPTRLRELLGLLDQVTAEPFV
jgi:two-component system response regulator AlgR